jgi:hypothetical protein
MHVAMFCFNRFNVMLMLIMPCMCLFEYINNLEMFSIKFGASFVFKSFSKFAFKNKLEK